MLKANRPFTPLQAENVRDLSNVWVTAMNVSIVVSVEVQRSSTPHWSDDRLVGGQRIWIERCQDAYCSVWWRAGDLTCRCRVAA